MKNKNILLPLIIGIAVIAVVGIIFYVNSNNSPKEESFVPIEEFAPAYNILAEARDEDPYKYQSDTSDIIIKVQYKPDTAEEEYYDIEETVRILNGLEIAQSQSKDFYSFLEYMAKQDYSMVPTDVIEAKMELLAILQEMFILEQENEELNGLTAITNSLGTAIYTLVKERNISDSVEAATDILVPSGAILGNLSLTSAISAILDTESLEEAKICAFNKYEEHQKLKADNKERIEVLKRKYLEYLDNFTPIYMKYINEWEKLCLAKDEAYLAAYSGRYVDCYETTLQILEKYPANREAMLLKALACVSLAQGPKVAVPAENTLLTITDENASERYKFLTIAQRTLENYIDLYPGKAAPALLLMGELELTKGNTTRAMSYFDQSAIEYPKQAAELNDMLNSYYMRSYLNATPEGQYLMRLYCSTVEGQGYFSPNFHKAKYWESIDNNEKAATEIYNHFFRRDKQGIYDCLLTDMEFCENNLYSSFKSQFMESSALNISVTEDTHVFGKNGVTFTLTNNSDLTLENIRLFVCLHLKDMYVNEYDIFPCETVNIFNPGEQVTWSTNDYRTEDIVRVRAIMLTDNKVCWVDDIRFKHSNAMRNYYQHNGKVTRSLEMFEGYGLSDGEIIQKIESNITGELATDDSKKGIRKNAENQTLTIELPRILCLLDPVLSFGELNKMKTPVSQTLHGSIMKAVFKIDSSAAREPIYLYSNFINLKIEYDIAENGKFRVTDITKI